MILISSGGYIYTQDMDLGSSAIHGPFYVTNTIDIVHPDISVSTNIIIFVNFLFFIY
jgi:E3 ubiquitin-protein ligase UBR4